MKPVFRLIGIVIALGATAALAADDSARRAAVDGLRNEVPGVQIYETGSRVTQAVGKPMSFGNTAAESADQFRIRHAEVFGAKAADLKPTAVGRRGVQSQPVMFDRETGQYKFSLITYRQERQGVPVFRADLRLLVRNEPGFPLVLAEGNVRDLGGFVPGPVAAQFDPKQVETGMTAFTKAEPVIWAGIGDKDSSPVLAVRFVGSNGVSGTGDIQRWLFIVDPANGTILYREDLIVHTDVSGNVSGMATTGNGADNCEPEALTGMPHATASIQGGNSATADASGNYVIANGGTSAVTVDSPMSGPYFTISDAGQAEETLSQSVTPPGPADFVHNAANTSEFTRAEVNGYIQANITRDFTLTQNPAYPTISSQTGMPVNVNIRGGQLCPGNAWYDPGDITLNFCRAARGFPNTAFSSIVNHEFGHHMVAMGGSGQGEYGEGMGDCIAVLIADDPVLAPGFSGNCSSGLRNADNTLQYPCGSSSIHTCGQILSGCVWSTRNELIVTNPTTYLDILSSLTVNSILLHAGSDITPQIYNDFLALDDDDADLSNGTPHKTEITAGFAAHNMVPAAGPANDDCSNATVACNGEVFNGSTANANSDGTVSCADASNSPSVWFSYTPATSGSATFSMCGAGTDYDGAMSVHTACPGEVSNEVGCDDDTCSAGGPAEITLSVTGGTDYLVRVSGWNGENGNFTFTITGPECSGCTSNGDCDDGDACNGVETCNIGTGACESGIPVNCDDGDACTADSCDSGTGACSNDPIVPCCGNGTCETGEDQCNCSADCGTPPSTETVCDDGIDEDCDGATDCVDSDCAGTPECPNPTNAIVDCIVYDKSVTVDVFIVDNFGDPIAGASVTAEVFVNGGSIGTATDTTGSGGVAGFRLRGVSNGACITTGILDVTAAGLTWDGTEPANGYQKQVDTKPDADCRNCSDLCGDNSCGQ